jgi:hypothetical protein
MEKIHMITSHYLPVEEDLLPPGQKPIETSSLKQLATLARLLIISRPRAGYSAMGVITGHPGVGKSIAVQAFVQTQSRQPHTGLPACIVIRVKPDSTPKAFVEDLLLVLEEPRMPRLETNRYQLADRAAELIIRHDIQLIFVDEAEQLNVIGFEFLRYLFSKTVCPLILVGDGRIIPMLDRQPKFDSRTPLYQDFLPPSDQEILDTVLPQLHVPGWTFDPTNSEDLAMGRDMWTHAKRSFRNLRMIVQFACLIAGSLADLEGDAPRITTTFLSEQIYPLLRLSKTKKQPAREDEQGEVRTPTEYDRESEQRYAARQKKVTRRKSEHV